MTKLVNIQLLLASWSCLAVLARAKSIDSPIDFITDIDNAIAKDADADPFDSW